MSSMHYVGLDVHKKTVAFCIKRPDGEVIGEGEVAATRPALSAFAGTLSPDWIGAMEATLFTGWIYDHLNPMAGELKVAHPAMLKAIGAGKKKNDRVDARTIADLLRCDLLPECYIAPTEIRDLRRALRFRTLVMRQAVRMKNKSAGLLMEVGAQYNKSRLHGKRYFAELLETAEDVPDSVKELLKMSRAASELFAANEKQLVRALVEHPTLRTRVERLQTIRGVGQITALTWALEIGDPHRFASIRRAVSYCGLCSEQKESAGKERRGPISKKRNKHLQTVLIEAAKIAPQWNPRLAEIREHERARGNRNRATLAVARKLVAYLMAVDKSGQPFVTIKTVASSDAADVT